ncbi:gas vesicle protein [Haloterrigena sp. SYSU A558-1]|uniref:Gas vesicle protein n=1 Tax=Haloterrigena gelatinilytica TaxID=2741724 RepID=A0A8J8KIT3_9EURY|nr:gas vesicle protein [Haloterrigena gelatinilytica]NUB92624.1 gas vesicle protein [Haloterrigena gelatinilytica]NUC71461.1 gas vesicle protein [Haloterrigena gelatinilytica]
MVDDFQPSRQKADLAEVVEMLLDKGIVINADIAVSIGDTQLLGVQLRAAIASFETAAKYGLEFPEGTDMRRVAAAVDDPEIAETERPNPVIDPTSGVNVTPDERYEDEETETESERGDSSDDESAESYEMPDRGVSHLGARPDPARPTRGGFDLLSDDSDGDGENETESDGDEDADSTENGGGEEVEAEATNAEDES